MDPWSPQLGLTLAESLVYLGYILTFIIFIKLLIIGSNLNFLNILFTLNFLILIILGFFMIPSFFDIGEINFLDEKKSEKLLDLCGKW